jgi:hypothetical protein
MGAQRSGVAVHVVEQYEKFDIRAGPACMASGGCAAGPGYRGAPGTVWSLSRSGCIGNGCRRRCIVAAPQWTRDQFGVGTADASARTPAR